MTSHEEQHRHLITLLPTAAHTMKEHTMIELFKQTDCHSRCPFLPLKIWPIFATDRRRHNCRLEHRVCSKANQRPLRVLWQAAVVAHNILGPTTLSAWFCRISSWIACGPHHPQPAFCIGCRFGHLPIGMCEVGPAG
jgi:hypothetical protein